MAYKGFTWSFGNHRWRCYVHALIYRGCKTPQFGLDIHPIYHVRTVARCYTWIHVGGTSYQSRTIRTSVWFYSVHRIGGHVLLYNLPGKKRSQLYLTATYGPFYPYWQGEEALFTLSYGQLIMAIFPFIRKP